ncbi:unnamed protein product [Candida verbasci]|uniref:Uncharacterized protein n=1 Tax=Candida verbasci TaxID=1227364 RepID=A0A9W4TS06_9ASCO|nr:unnamed protein product [Candida verbasci]
MDNEYYYQTIPPSYQRSLIPFTRDLTEIPDTQRTMYKNIDILIAPTLPALQRGVFEASKKTGLISSDIISKYYIMENSVIHLCKDLEKLILQTWTFGADSRIYAEQFILAYDLAFVDLPFLGKTQIDEFEIRILKDLYVDLFSNRKIIKMALGKCHQIIVKKDREQFHQQITRIVRNKYGYNITYNSENFSSALFTLTLLIYIDKMRPCIEPINFVTNKIKSKTSRLKFKFRL